MATPQSQQIKNNFVNHPYVQQASRALQGQVSQLDAELNKYPVLRDVEAKTKIPKAYGVLGLGGVAVLLIFFNLFGLAQPVSNLIGWGLPAYLSIKALESPSTNDDKQWLTYWIVYGTFNLIESVALRPILYWVPFYFVFKSVFIVWLFLPSTRGAEILYFNVLRRLAVNINRPGPTFSSTSTSSSSTFGSSSRVGGASSTLGGASSTAVPSSLGAATDNAFASTGQTTGFNPSASSAFNENKLL
jgi:receptor expression-enhancing protein 5/6